jgi:hypothetical protein
MSQCETCSITLFFEQIDFPNSQFQFVRVIFPVVIEILFFVICLRFFSWYSEEYDWFYIDSESQFYTLHVSLLAVGDAGDSLNAPWNSKMAANAMKFSSQNADHDMSINHCALQSGGGWWFNDCSHSSMFGDPIVNVHAGYQWHGLTYIDDDISADATLMASRMMIKAVE